MDPEMATAQDVIDALRFAFMAQKDATKRAHLVEALLEYAPETEDDRGIQFLLVLLSEGTIRVELV